MFQVGDKVVSKKTGFPACGTVKQIVSVLAYLRYCVEKHVVTSFVNWDKLYPDWMVKPLVTVEFESPIPTTTWEEFETQYRRMGFSGSDYELKEAFDKRPKVTGVIYPIDDLELFE